MSILPQSVHLWNAYRDRKNKKKPAEEQMKVPQAFTFMAREGVQLFANYFKDPFRFYVCLKILMIIENWLATVVTWFAGFPPGESIDLEERIPRRLQGGDRDLDVFALVKQNMSDSGLAQDALLVMPQTLKDETQHFMRMVNRAPPINPELSPERVEELKNIADEIEVDFPHMQRAVAYYRTLVSENAPLTPYPKIKFLNQVDRCGNRWCKFNLDERAPRPKPHPLRVTFHRNRG